MKEIRSAIARMVPALAAAAIALPLTASAQVSTSASSIAHEGPNGLKVGEGRLHPFFDLEPRLDTAAGFFPTTGGGLSTQPSPELILHLRPGVKFELPSNVAAIDFAGDLEYLYYTGLLAPGSYVASRLEGAANLNVALNRQGQVQFDLADDFAYSDKTRNLSAVLGVLSLFNEARAQLDIRPGGGALEIAPRGAFALEQFRALSTVTVPGCPSGEQTCDPAAVQRMNYINIRGGLDARWKFLPKTAIVLESNFDARSYTDPLSTNQPSLLLRVVGGLQGLLTTKIAVVAKGGWGYDFVTSATPGTNANTFLAQAEGTYLLNEASNFKLGYYRSVEPVPAFQTVQDDRIYGEARALLAGRLVLRAYGAVDFLGFGNGPPPAPRRFDVVITADPAAEYQIFPWLYAAAGYTLTSRSSSTTTPSTTSYLRQEAYLRVTAAY